MSKYVGKIVTNQAPAGYSVAFNGSTGYLSIPDNAAFDLGSGDFTIEAWLYITAGNTTGAGWISQWTSGLSWFFGTSSIGPTINEFLFGYTTNGSTILVIGSGYIVTSALNQWTHFAVTRSGTSVRLFVNGVQRGSTGTLSGTIFNSSDNIVLGRNDNTPSGWYLSGYMSNARVVKGTALYTTAFTPPTQLLNITNTSLLTCNSPAIVDQSSNAFAITTNGSAAVSTFTPFAAYNPYNPALGASTPGVWTLDEAMQAAATRQWNMYDPSFNSTTLLLHGNPTNGASFITDASTNNFTITPVGDTRAANLSPFSLTSFPNSGAGYFDGTGDWLTLPSTNSLVFGTGDFCVEFWLNRTGTTGGIFSNSQSVGGGDAQFEIALNVSNRVVLIGWSTTFITGATTINTGTWYHIAVVRSGTSMAIFVNGARDATATSANNFSSTNAFLIGAQAGGSGRTTGYVSNLRAVKGSSVYDPAQATITVPTAPLTAITNTSLLTLQNSQSANNNAFLDSSSNNFLITRNGNTTQGSFSPFSQTGWSNYFDGSGDYISAPANAAFNFGTGDFTIEFWYYPNSISGARTLIEVNYGTAPNFIMQPSSGVMNFYTNGVSVFVASNVTDTIGSWYHYAAVRNGSTITLYRNGISVGTTTYSGNVGNSSVPCFIGGSLGGGGYYIDGYLSNVRVVKGTAVYTSNFTPSPIPLTAITNTSLLTCQSNRFVDNSSNGFVISVAGNTSVQAFSPFYPTAAYTPQTIGGSGYFDGTGDYLSVANNSAFQFGSGDWTFETWVYGTNFSTTRALYALGYGYTNTDRSLVIYIGTSGDFRIAQSPDGSTNYDESLGLTLSTNCWNHLVVSRSGSTVKGFLNGTGGTGLTARNLFASTKPIYIGAQEPVYPAPYVGYMSSVRVLKGTGYTSVTVPTAPLTAIANTQLLLNFTNAGIVDSTAKNVLETVGNAQISTTQSKFGGSSMYFDGAGDNLVVGPTPLLNFGASDFTIEFWIYPANFSAVVYPLYSTSARAKTDVLALEMGTGGTIVFYATASGGGVWSIASAATMGTLTVATWNHIALVRNGSSFRGYVNGVQSASLATNSSALASFDGFNIGTNGAGGGFLNGYMDDLRITRFARYTAAFTPQTSQWQDQ